MWIFVVIAFILSFLSLSSSLESVDSNLQIVDIDILVDLTSHLTKVTSTIKLTNGGHQPVDGFHYTLDPYISGKLSFIGAKEVDGEENTTILKVEYSEVDQPYNGAIYYRISFPNQLKHRKTVSIVVETVYADAQSPLPKMIAQDDRQLVQFNGNLYHFSPYHTSSEIITLHLASDKIESYTQIRPVNLNRDTIIYGPFKDISPYDKQKFTVHFENHSPFLTTWYLDRWIEVSHWGNIAIEEKLHIQHTGARLKGSFSRYDFQRNPYGGSPSAIRSFKTLLPSSARDVYYRDAIGNISTSHLLDLHDAVEIEIRPRFPLFGGWQTRYTIGYNLPSYEYLFQQGSQYGFKMRFLDHIYNNQFVDEIKVSIVLPEGARDIVFSAPYAIDNLTENLHFTYLDTIGRPIIQVRKRCLVDNHIKDFTLYYKFNTILLLQEPMLVFTTFFFIFLVVIIFVRLDFSIIKDKSAVMKMQLGEALSEFCSLFDRKLMLVNKMSLAIEKFKSNKDRASFKNEKNQIEIERKQFNLKISHIERENRFLPEIAGKLADINLKDIKLKQNLDHTFSLFEKSGVKTSHIHAQEDSLSRERVEILHQIQNLLSTL